MVKNSWKIVLGIVLLFQACSPGEEKSGKAMLASDFFKTELFKEVQLASVFPDSKTFPDCTPKMPYQDIISAYEHEKTSSEFDLKAFVNEYFEMPYQPATGYKSDTTLSMVEHIEKLWPVLTRNPDENNKLSSLIPLPNKYIVPGGRFREIYYWDSYFTIEGLMEDEKTDMAKSMLDNFTFLIDSIGFIPNGNRAYYQGRSQPPFYSLIVSRLGAKNRDLFMSYLPEMVAEYNFWMRGENDLKNGEAAHRVVMLPDGAVLNRYWDDLQGPRPESFKEDYELVHEYNLDTTIAYKNLRAGAESGWDYSSRWFADHKNLSTIETTNIIPIDLNSLLYHLELKIAQGYNWKGQLDSVDYYLKRADKRRDAINKYLWDDQEGFFVDYNFKKKASTGVKSLAAAYPLYFKIATKNQAKKTARLLVEKFLYAGGFVTTLNDTGQQWDYPNGWAPLQWITVNGLFNYEFNEEGLRGMQNWLDRNREVYKATGKMMEKYNVIDTTLHAGGGEYPLQDGFGWTNGVALAFEGILKRQALVLEPSK